MSEPRRITCPQGCENVYPQVFKRGKPSILSCGHEDWTELVTSHAWPDGELRDRAEEETERADVLSGMLREMARKVIKERRYRRERVNLAHNRMSRAVHQRKSALQKVGTAVGVHVGSPGEDRYPVYEDRICAAALRLRADEAEKVVALLARAERAEADLAQARKVLKEISDAGCEWAGDGGCSGYDTECRSCMADSALSGSAPTGEGKKS